MPFHGKSFLRKQLLSYGTAGSFSEDRPEGGTLLPKAIGRAMEWPGPRPRRKLPTATPKFLLLYRPKNSGSFCSILASALPRWLMASFSSGVSWA